MRTRHKDTRGRISPIILNLNSDGGELSDSRPGRFMLGKRASATH